MRKLSGFYLSINNALQKNFNDTIKEMIDGDARVTKPKIPVANLRESPINQFFLSSFKQVLLLRLLESL